MSKIVDVHIGKIGFKMAYHEGNQCDADLAECLRRFGAPEPEVVHAMFRIVRPGDTVIDGGANMGFFTLVLSKLVGKKGRVIAVEPGKNNLRELGLNLSLNNSSNVTVVTKPLWGSHKKVKLYLTPHGGFNSIGKQDDCEVVELDTVTLRDLTEGPPRLIKLDIEGSEHEALSDMYKGTPFIISELNEKALNRLGSSRKSVRSFMRAYSYDTFLLLNEATLPIYVPEKTEIATDVEALNVLFSTCHDIGDAWTSVEVVPG